MNELYRTDPKLYSLMEHTDLDPYYRDEKLWSAVKFAAVNWEGGR